MYTYKWYEILKSRTPRGKRFLIYCRKFRLAFLQTTKTFGDTCLVPTVSFLQFFCEIRVVGETILKNNRWVIVFIVILVLGSFRKQGIVFSFFALEYEVEKIPLNAVKPNFVVIYVFFILTAASFIEKISS